MVPGTCADGPHHAVWPAGSSVAFSPGNLSTSSSASSTLGSPEGEEYILSFETIDKMRRVSSYSALNSLIGECRGRAPRPPLAGPRGSRGARGSGQPWWERRRWLGRGGCWSLSLPRDLQAVLGVWGRLPEASVCHSPVAVCAVTLPQETPHLSGPGQSSGRHP